MVEYKNRYGVDGILIGRAAMGNPFIFAQCKDILNGENNSVFHIKERVAVCKRHLEGLKEWRGDRYAILEMRKFYSGYFKGLNNFKPYRIRLVTTNSYEEIEEGKYINIIGNTKDRQKAVATINVLLGKKLKIELKL